MPGPVIPTPVRMQSGGGGGGAVPYVPQQFPLIGSPQTQVPVAPQGQVPLGEQGGLPVSPPTGGLIPSPATSPEQLAQRTSGWDQFLTNLTSPGMANSLLTFGTAFGSDRRPGQSIQDKLMESIRQTASGYAALQGQKRQEEIQNEGIRQEQQKLGLMGQEQGTRQAGQEEQVRANKEQEKIARERIASTEKYYNIMKQASMSKAAGDPRADRYYNIAQQGLQSQLNSMESLLGTMEPGTPQHQKLLDEFVRLNNDFQQLVMQRGGAMQGRMGSAGTAPKITLDDVVTLRQRPNWNMDPSGLDETRLKMALEANGLQYTPPAGAGSVQVESTVEKPEGPAPAAAEKPAYPQTALNPRRAADEALKKLRER